MRSVFLRAVLLGVLAALALAVARQARAETIVVLCTSATDPSPLRITWDTARKFVTVEDAAFATRDLYPLTDATTMDVVLAQFRREGKYQCRRVR